MIYINGVYVSPAELLIDAAGDTLYGSAADTLARLAKGDDDDILTLASGIPSWAAPAAGATVATGSYNGDDTVNRAIPHGLGVTPKVVIVFENTAYIAWRIQSGLNSVLSITNPDVPLAVTAPNTTNFYVGNATSYVKSINDGGKVYYWVAIG